MTGQRFGKLIAISISEEETKKRKGHNKIWKCLCDCGNITYASQANLVKGNVKSCGCYIKEARFKDMTGERFGHLTVISRGEDVVEKDKHAKRGYNIRRTWNCICGCGNYKNNILEKRLKSGAVISCGCDLVEKRKQIAQNNKKYNTYDLSGEYGVGYDAKGKTFIFDLDDYEKIKNTSWNVKYDDYVESRIGKKNISQHRLIMDFPDCHIDHINHKTNDNRKCNLRLVSREENQANTKTRVDNTSGTKGVYYNKGMNRWIACLHENGIRHSKSFIYKEDAITYRKILEKEYQKKYSYDESMKIGEEYEASIYY